MRNSHWWMFQKGPRFFFSLHWEHTHTCPLPADFSAAGATALNYGLWNVNLCSVFINLTIKTETSSTCFICTVKNEREQFYFLVFCIKMWLYVLNKWSVDSSFRIKPTFTFEKRCYTRKQIIGINNSCHFLVIFNSFSYKIINMLTRSDLSLHLLSIFQVFLLFFFLLCVCWLEIYTCWQRTSCCLSFRCKVTKKKIS